LQQPAGGEAWSAPLPRQESIRPEEPGFQLQPAKGWQPPRLRLRGMTGRPTRRRHPQPKTARLQESKLAAQGRPRLWPSRRGARDRAGKGPGWNGREVSTGNPKARDVQGQGWLRESPLGPERPGRREPSPEPLTAGRRRPQEETPGPRLREREVGASYAP
jgi:hypothetical protein